MNDEFLDIDLLIYNYIIDNLSGDEEKLLRELVNDSDFRKRFETITGKLYIIQNVNRWESIDTEKAKKNLFFRLKKKWVNRRLISYAASIAFILSCVLIFYFVTSDDEDERLVQHTPLVENRNIVLSYNQGYESLFLDSLTPGIINKIENISITDSNTIVYNPGNEKCSEDYHTLTVPKGCEYSVILEDGTRIWLNSETTLKYLSGFENSDSRRVELSGEAYFEVIKNSEKPFYVSTSEMEIEVLGTSFNIKSYPNEEYITTTVLTGKVQQYFMKNEERFILCPDYQTIYNRKSLTSKMIKADNKEVMAWKNGLIVMRSKTLEYIFRQLARWYDFEVVFANDSLKDLVFHLNIDRYEDIDEILSILEKTNGVRFKKENRIIEILE